MKENVSDYAQQILELNEEYNLVDIWRVSNPEAKRFTWRGMTRGGRVFSKLDYWLTSSHLIYDLVETSIDPSIKTDHSIISVTFELNNTDKKGRGFWKFNSMLLRDQEYITTIKQLIQNSKINNAHLTNKALLWDFMKCEIRGETISYSSFKAKEQRELETLLTSKLLKLEQEIDQTVIENEAAINEYHKIKQEIELINDQRATGYMIRSKAQWVENGEKCTKYFMQLENINYKAKYIKSLNWKDTIIKDPKEILNAEKEFYQNLYSEQVQYETCKGECSLLSSNPNTLTQIQSDKCDIDITLKECSKSLSELPNNKSPGSDGFTTEFYKFFWADIGQCVLDSFNYSLINGELSQEQRRGVLTLLPKPHKDLRELKNWRPISLLNTDYKMLTKLLANRLQEVIPSIVSEDQAGYIKSRYIGENVRTILDIIEYTSLMHNPGLMVFLDFEKAFDTVYWKFLFKTLKTFHFGDRFIKWIKTLYNKPHHV